MRSTGFAAAALLVSTALSAQSLDQEILGQRPVSTDYDFAENEDGSIIAADDHGTYYFTNWLEYVQSSFFQQHGLRCGNSRLFHPLGLGTTSDCSASNTNPAAEYDPQGGATYVIPVVFHVLHRPNGTGNISDALIQSQIDVLNEDFGGSGPFTNGTDTKIQFTLEAITRSSSNQWYNDGGSYWNSLAWDTTRYLNIYSNSAGGNLGYAYVPSGGGVVGNTWDRVVLYWPSVGRPAPYGQPYDMGRTATHEVGHYLGLYHTFDGGCASTSGCYNNGDLICDTNPESGPNFSPCSRSTCGNPDPTDNFMDYSDDICMTMFTSDQAHRMRCTMENFRVDLGDTGPTAPGPASSPSPSNGASSVSVNANLAWTAGSGATSHDVYFGTDPTPDAGELQGNQAGTTFDPGTLANSTTYYWRIDEVNAAGTTTGTVWSFTTESAGGGTPPGQATNPNPRDGRRRVKTTANLAWSAGAGATSHDVYIGTDPTPDSTEFQGNQTGTSFEPGLLQSNTTYYWRIDEVNAAGTTTGVVWSFTTR